MTAFIFISTFGLQQENDDYTLSSWCKAYKWTIYVVWFWCALSSCAYVISMLYNYYELQWYIYPYPAGLLHGISWFTILGTMCYWLTLLYDANGIYGILNIKLHTWDFAMQDFIIMRYRLPIRRQVIFYTNDGLSPIRPSQLIEPLDVWMQKSNFPSWFTEWSLRRLFVKMP